MKLITTKYNTECRETWQVIPIGCHAIWDEHTGKIYSTTSQRAVRFFEGVRGRAR